MSDTFVRRALFEIRVAISIPEKAIWRLLLLAAIFLDMRPGGSKEMPLAAKGKGAMGALLALVFVLSSWILPSAALAVVLDAETRVMGSSGSGAFCIGAGCVQTQELHLENPARGVQIAIGCALAAEAGGGALVRYDADFAAQQILKSTTNVTPGGRTISVHAAERMMTPPAGRAPTTMAEIDQFLDTATQVRKISPHPLGDTITLRNATAPRVKEVVVDAATGQRVITVITPNR
jgi:hypothetical protein